MVSQLEGVVSFFKVGSSFRWLLVRKVSSKNS